MSNVLRAGCLLVLAITLISLVGCDPESTGLGPSNHDSYDQAQGGFGNSSGQSGATINGGFANAGGNIDPNSNPQLIIGSFNIQVFGRAKMSKPGVVGVLTDIVRRFDILAIQELREKEQSVIPEFLKYINADGSSYAAAVGPRQGYVSAGQTTRHFEQAVFIYDTTKVELLGPTYAAHDRYQIMHRSPFVGHFRSLVSPPERAFSFVLMNVHIDPDDAHIEFEALQEIIGEIYANHRGEDDFILLGDMNDSPDQYQKYQWMRNQLAVLPPELKTNTAGTKAYDNLVLDADYTAELRNQAGVMNLMDVYQLTMSQAKLVSDHYPVWAVFSALESPRAQITQGAPPDLIR